MVLRMKEDSQEWETSRSTKPQEQYLVLVSSWFYNLMIYKRCQNNTISSLILLGTSESELSNRAPSLTVYY